MLALACSASFARAQPAAPRIGYIYPAGGMRGTTVQVIVGGQALAGVKDVYAPGLDGTVIEYTRPLSPKEQTELRDELKMLTGKGPATRPARSDDNEKRIAEIRKKLAGISRKPPNPGIAETVTIEFTIARDAPPGEREIRLRAPGGLTNPLKFIVGEVPEFRETPPAPEQARPKDLRPVRRGDPPRQSSAAEADNRITIPGVANGQILPGDVDRFRFRARKGQRLVAAVAAQRLMPYLPDAVPGWFQATLSLHDAAGRELAYCDDFRFHPDPVILCEIPRDGDYVLEIHDAIYRGREDFVYRVEIGELPFITSIFPLGATVGTQTTVSVAGWNLPKTTLVEDARDAAPGRVELSMAKGTRTSNVVRFALDATPDTGEKEPNDRVDSAQRITLPIIVNGRIDATDDRDSFAFEGRAGAEVVVEAYARRLGSPVDSTVELTDAQGQRVAFNDDHEDKGEGLTTHQADSRIQATLPADGIYYASITDAQRKGGPEYAYRLRISPPQPDFELRVVPSTVSVRPGSAATLTVYALRKDGFNGDILLSLVDAPDGFKLGGARVPAGEDKVVVTLNAAQRGREAPFALALQGRATIAGHERLHRAVAAEDMMQAFAYRHLVPAPSLLVTVAGRGGQGSALRLLSTLPIKLTAGGSGRVRIGGVGRGFVDEMQLELSNPPEGIRITRVAPTDEGAEIVFQSDAAKVKPGQKGNLIIQAFMKSAPTSKKGKPQDNKRRTPVGTLPAIPFEFITP